MNERHPQEINLVVDATRMTQDFVDLANEAFITECIAGQERLGAAMRSALTAQAIRQLAEHGVTVQNPAEILSI